MRSRLPLATATSLGAAVVISVLAFAATADAQNFMTGDNSTVVGCSNRCSYEDPSLECWNKTLSFFERILLGQMRHYVAVQMNIDQWRRRREKPYTSRFKEARRLSIASLISESHLQEDDIVNASTVETVVGALVDLAALQSNHTITWTPHYSCPIPCEYRYTVWRNLFIASTILNLCLFIAVIPFVKRISRSDSSEAALIRG